MRPLATFVSLLLFLTALPAKDKKKDPGQIGNRDVGKGINFYSLEREIALGRQLSEEVQRQAKLVTDPIVTEYINRIGQNLVRNSDARVPFSFQIVQSDELNAFALPGGFIYVNSGLIKLAETEAELAGAMAHEVAHVAARHITRQATRNQIANLATIPLMVWGGWTGYAVRQGAGVGIPLTFLTFSRGFEAEADFLGLQYMYAAGYDPTASIEIFEKLMSLERTKPGAIAKVFSTHPMNADRIRNTQKEIQEILPSKPEYVVDTSAYNEVRLRLLALENQRKNEKQDENRPRLRKAPGAAPSGSEDEDGRPTIRRRDWVD